MSGDAVPDDCDFCEPLVPVRIGGGGWKCESWWDGMVGCAGWEQRRRAERAVFK